MKSVYFELFIIDNILINYYFLYISGALLHIPINHTRAIFSSILGAVYAYLQITNYPFLALFPFKLIMSVLMLYISYKPSITKLIRLLICFLTVAFIFAGGIMAILFSTSSDSLLRFIVMLPIPLRFAMLILLCGHFLKKHIIKSISLLAHSKQGITLHLPFAINKPLQCFSDSGNNCKYFGTPVVFINKKQLPHPQAENIYTGNILQTQDNINIVYIPFSIAGGEVKTAPGFKCSKALVKKGSICKELDIYIALTNHDFGGEPCLVNPALLD